MCIDRREHVAPPSKQLSVFPSEERLLGVHAWEQGLERGHVHVALPHLASSDEDGGLGAVPEWFDEQVRRRQGNELRIYRYTIVFKGFSFSPALKRLVIELPPVKFQEVVNSF